MELYARPKPMGQMGLRSVWYPEKGTPSSVNVILSQGLWAENRTFGRNQGIKYTKTEAWQSTERLNPRAIMMRDVGRAAHKVTVRSFPQDAWEEPQCQIKLNSSRSRPQGMAKRSPWGRLVIRLPESLPTFWEDTGIWCQSKSKECELRVGGWRSFHGLLI